MTTHEPDDPGHAWLDAALEERLGGATPPDLTASVLGTARPPASRRGRRRPALAAAALVAVGVSVILGVRALRDDGPAGDGAEAWSPQDPAPARPVRVLYVDAQPRWEYRYLKNALLTAPGLATQVFLCGAAPEFAQEHSDGLPALTALPSTAEALGVYDAIVVRDVTPADVAVAADPPDGPGARWAAALVGYAEVRAGGGIAFLCGPRGMPSAWRGTALADLLPVELAADGAAAPDPELPTGHHPELTPAGGTHPVLSPPGAELQFASALCDFRFFTLVPLGAPRGGAEVLATASGAPLLVAGRSGAVRTFVVATDETWRVRAPYADKLHRVLWQRVVRWLAGHDG